MISKRLRDLIKQAQMNKEAGQFWKKVERLAEKYEVTCDYILQEFYVDV